MSDTEVVPALPAAERRMHRTLSSQTLLALLIACLGIVAFLLVQAPQAGNVLNLILPDHDDAIRLLSVRDLLAGQSWFDTHQYRYLPPEGVLMHWSRLADAPLAAGIWLLTPFLGQPSAEAYVALLWPPLLLLLYLAITTIAVRRIAPSIAAAIAVLVAGQMIIFNYIFGVGRIDHHAVQIVLITVAALAFAFYSATRLAPELSGIFAGLSLAVGLETLPFVAVIGVANVFAWVFDEDRAGVGMMRFSFALLVASLVAFGIQTQPALWMISACDMLSPPWLLIACSAATVTAGLAAATPLLTSATWRTAAAILGGAAVIGVFAFVYPECLAGPYQMVPQPYRAIWLGDIGETQPGWLRLAEGSDAIFQSFGPLLIAALAASVLACQSTGTTRRLMAICAGCLGIGVALSLLQVRGFYIVSAFIPPVAGIAVWRLIGAVRGGHVHGFRAAASVLAAFAFLGPVWLAPAAAMRQLAPDSARAQRPESDCLLKENISALGGLPQGVILAPANLGAFTLLHTHHSIIVAGFHRGVEGIIAGIEAFKGSEADMYLVVHKHAPDYLVICPGWAKAETVGPESFAGALAEGASVPWLEPVALQAGSLMVWRVRPEMLPPS